MSFNSPLLNNEHLEKPIQNSATMIENATNINLNVDGLIENNDSNENLPMIVSKDKSDNCDNTVNNENSNSFPDVHKEKIIFDKNLENENSIFESTTLTSQSNQTNSKNLGYINFDLLNPTAAFVSPTINGHSSPKIQKSQEQPFPLLAGEQVYLKEKIVDGVIYLTNYRLYFDPSYDKSDKSSQKNYQPQSQHEQLIINLPLSVIDFVDVRDTILLVFTKFIQSFTFFFENNDIANVWNKRIVDSTNIKNDDLFCFKFCSNLSFQSEDNRIKKLIDFNKEEMELLSNHYEVISKEYKRMNFNKSWKIFELNNDFKFCITYPQYFILPTSSKETDLENVGNFRYSRRIPVVVWRSQKNGCVIARSAQPVLGLFASRCEEDEELLRQILRICRRDVRMSNKSKNDDDLSFSSLQSESDETSLNSSFDTLSNSPSSKSNGSRQYIDNILNNKSPERLNELERTEKLLILDARSYTAAFANRAIGGGFECEEYYPYCQIEFLGLNNIHSIRKSFYALRSICDPSQIDNAK